MIENAAIDPRDQSPANRQDQSDRQADRRNGPANWYSKAMFSGVTTAIVVSRAIGAAMREIEDPIGEMGD